MEIDLFLIDEPIEAVCVTYMLNPEILFESRKTGKMGSVVHPEKGEG
jgi:hypothetical protein